MIIFVRIISHFNTIFKCTFLYYKGCSNMNASIFITFVTYMLRQNGIRFYKGLYVTFKLAPDLKKNTVYLSSYSPLNEGLFIILTYSMLRTTKQLCQCTLNLHLNFGAILSQTYRDMTLYLHMYQNVYANLLPSVYRNGLYIRVCNSSNIASVSLCLVLF